MILGIISEANNPSFVVYVCRTAQAPARRTFEQPPPINFVPDKGPLFSHSNHLALVIDTVCLSTASTAEGRYGVELPIRLGQKAGFNHKTHALSQNCNTTPQGKWRQRLRSHFHHPSPFHAMRLQRKRAKPLGPSERVRPVYPCARPRSRVRRWRSKKAAPTSRRHSPECSHFPAQPKVYRKNRTKSNQQRAKARPLRGVWDDFLRLGRSAGVYPRRILAGAAANSRRA